LALIKRLDETLDNQAILDPFQPGRKMLQFMTQSGFYSKLNDRVAAKKPKNIQLVATTDEKKKDEDDGRWRCLICGKADLPCITHAAYCARDHKGKHLPENEWTTLEHRQIKKIVQITRVEEGRRGRRQGYCRRRSRSLEREGCFKRD
jgi:hypothetical protein